MLWTIRILSGFISWPTSVDVSAELLPKDSVRFFSSSFAIRAEPWRSLEGDVFMWPYAAWAADRVSGVERARDAEDPLLLIRGAATTGVPPIAVPLPEKVLKFAELDMPAALEAAVVADEFEDAADSLALENEGKIVPPQEAPAVIK